MIEDQLARAFVGSGKHGADHYCRRSGRQRFHDIAGILDAAIGNERHTGVAHGARCFGNLDYGIKELERSDALGRSEMLAFAWDIENNVRAELSFIVPHKRD